MWFLYILLDFLASKLHYYQDIYELLCIINFLLFNKNCNKMKAKKEEDHILHHSRSSCNQINPKFLKIPLLKKKPKNHKNFRIHEIAGLPFHVANLKTGSAISHCGSYCFSFFLLNIIGFKNRGRNVK